MDRREADTNENGRGDSQASVMEEAPGLQGENARDAERARVLHELESPPCEGPQQQGAGVPMVSPPSGWNDPPATTSGSVGRPVRQRLSRRVPYLPRPGEDQPAAAVADDVLRKVMANVSSCLARHSQCGSLLRQFNTFALQWADASPNEEEKLIIMEISAMMNREEHCQALEHLRRLPISKRLISIRLFLNSCLTVILEH